MYDVGHEEFSVPKTLPVHVLSRLADEAMIRKDRVEAEELILLLYLIYDQMAE
jgi:hypothetical protein